MYATAAVLAVRTSTHLPFSGFFKRLRARRTASNSRQLMRQCRWGPIHTPDTVCQLYVAPQLVAEASVNTTECLDTCSKGTPARRNEGSDHGLKVWWHAGVEPLKEFQWDRPPAFERIQAVQHRPSAFLCEARCLCDRIQLHTEKRDPLHRGEFALFPVDLTTQMAEVPEHEVPVFA
ncbi:hypothetical protein PO909_003588 [Leuciscus waleckii]